MKSWKRWLWLGLIVLASGGAGYYGWEEWQQREQMEKLSWQTARANRELTQHTDWIERLDRAVDSVQKTQTTLSNTLRQQRITLNSITGSAQRHWQLQEADYLLELAQQHLIMRSDLNGAESLLLTADAILRQLNEPSLANVRAALASDIASVRATAEPDIVGIYVRIAALVDQLDGLPLLSPAGFASITSTMHFGERDDEKLGWAQRLQASVSGLVKVHRGEPVKPLASPEQSVYIAQNMRLMLEQAQAALLRGLQPAYRDSLKRADAWLQRHYLGSAVSTRSVRTEIAKLLRREVGTPLPDITRAIQEIRQVLANDSLRLAPGAARAPRAKSAADSDDAR